MSIGILGAFAVKFLCQNVLLNFVAYINHDVPKEDLYHTYICHTLVTTRAFVTKSDDFITFLMKLHYILINYAIYTIVQILGVGKFFLYV